LYPQFTIWGHAGAIIPINVSYTCLGSLLCLPARKAPVLKCADTWGRIAKMAQAIVVTLEKELQEAVAAYAKTASGRALARELDRLDFAARKCKVTAVSSLLSESQAALIAQMREEGFDPSKMRLPAEQWYDAAEGLKTVRGLAEHVAAHLNDFKQPNPILRDLKAVETLLAAVDSSGGRFHFTKTTL